MDDTRFQERIGWLHVDDFSRARIADRPAPANEEHAVFVNLKAGIIDPFVIILRPFEDDSAGFMNTFSAGLRQESATEIFRDHTGFHQRRIKEITGENKKTRLLPERLIDRADHFAV